MPTRIPCCPPFPCAPPTCSAVLACSHRPSSCRGQFTGVYGALVVTEETSHLGTPALPRQTNQLAIKAPAHPCGLCKGPIGGHLWASLDTLSVCRFSPRSIGKCQCQASTATIKLASPLVAQLVILTSSFSAQRSCPILLSTTYLFGLQTLVVFYFNTQNDLQSGLAKRSKGFTPKATQGTVAHHSDNSSAHLPQPTFLPQDKPTKLGLTGSSGSVPYSSPGYNDSCPACVTSRQ